LGKGIHGEAAGRSGCPDDALPDVFFQCKQGIKKALSRRIDWKNTPKDREREGRWRQAKGTCRCMPWHVAVPCLHYSFKNIACQIVFKNVFLYGYWNGY
jgi:hypothetical protein